MTNPNAVGLGNFSVSLAVKNLEVSREFYAKLGFEKVAGNGTHYLIMQSGTTTIGLFQGLFEKNALTFNPGWDHRCQTLPEFADVHALEARFRAAGIEPAKTGPASFQVVDPDGNPILFDQHV